jgi:hypothetical protein
MGLSECIDRLSGEVYEPLRNNHKVVSAVA